MKRFLFLIFLLGTFPLLSQDDESGEKEFCKEVDKDAVKLYRKGIDRKKFHKPERMDFLKKALEIEPDFAEANLAMGFEIAAHCKLESKPFAPTVPYFYKALACPQIHSEPYYYIGYSYYEQLKNDSAIKYLEKFLKFKENDEKKYAKDYDGEVFNAKGMLSQIKMENTLVSKPLVPFDPKVVKGVSTERDEYLAYVSPDDQKCFFVRKVPLNSKDKVYSSDKEKEMFMISVKDKMGHFDKGEAMPWPFNETDDNQGGCTISIDNKNLYFSMMRFEGGAQGNCDIYLSKNVDGEWKPIQKVSGINHPVYWDSQPTLSADGNSLIFASDRPGGYGGIDLYISTKDQVTKQWGPPQNLGPKINTPGDEKTPFIHSDSETLYFSSGPNKRSEGHFGYGGYDIFFSRKDDKGHWAEPTNIGAPINSKDDDTGFFVSSDALTGYFFSFDEGKVRGRGIGRYDLYSFELYKEARPHQTDFVKGTAKDDIDNNIRGAEIEVKNIKTNEKIATITDSISGEFVIAVNKKQRNSDLLITLKKDGYAFTSRIVNLKETPPGVPHKDVNLITGLNKTGSTFVINDIHYNTNSADLKDESKAVVEAFAKYLKDNPKITIEIQGHTDNVGNAAANQALSANRAFTVKAILESFGIDGERIQATGFGSSKPIAENTSEEGRAKNRRTEFEILNGAEPD